VNDSHELQRLEAWMAAQSGWKVELMALGLALRRKATGACPEIAISGDGLL